MEPETLAQADNIRPLVAQVISNRGPWIFAGLLALAAAGLFAALEARRNTVISPATMASPDLSANVITAPPGLDLPNNPQGDPGYFGSGYVPPAARMPTLVPQTLPGVPRTPRVVQRGFIPGPPIARTPNYYDPNSPDAVVRPGLAPIGPPPRTTAEDAAPADRLSGDRVRATTFTNPSFTVPQGTVIQAVLETALDSNRPGFVRAIVSRDVRSFDGAHVLIPRGSRLFGEYKADLAQGQSRAFVQWLKLTRPDGAQIAIGSPAADPLGRAGVGGKVNRHFLQRFSGAILQSALDIGVGIATRSASDGAVVVGLPGSTQNLVSPAPDTIKPTLRVRHGSSVSVFVARDLDFSTVD